MTPEQEAHLGRIQRLFSTEVDGKYRQGQEEHGGNLFDMPAKDLVDNAILEAIDQIVYLYTLRDKLNASKT